MHVATCHLCFFQQLMLESCGQAMGSGDPRFMSAKEHILVLVQAIAAGCSCFSFGLFLCFSWFLTFTVLAVPVFSKIRMAAILGSERTRGSRDPED